MASAAAFTAKKPKGKHYVGSDVSVKLKAIIFIDETSKVVMERAVASDPDDIGRCIE